MPIILPQAATTPVSLFGAAHGPALSPDGLAGSVASASGPAAGSALATTPAITLANGTVASAPFADLLSEAVGQVEAYEGQAKSAIEGLMTGQGVDVHQATIATEKAEAGFELLLAVRNKALSAYQQVMGLQF